ncbi:helix-turn-helix domain-containing protein [Azospirillum canadense]|uniref:helix-turn-helix domain-containing protein n=1 Tax=Azospirillum canadense TaxID=403962 RepID=UPI0022275825|nr:helix-turn-helix domain-containing protein [Azospirillum canadense]MCW2241856.1 hypothetical protein [Azospirillum canadense]
MDPKEFSGRRGFVLASWLDHPDVDVSAFAVLAALATYADPSGLCWPHPKTIAERLKRSRPWVLGVLDRLVEAGLIERRPRRGHAKSGRWEFVLVGFAFAFSSNPAPRSQPSDSRSHPADSEQSQNQNTSLSALVRGDVKRGFGVAAERLAPANVNTATAPWQPSPEDLAHAAAERPDLTAEDLGRMTRKLLAHHSAQLPANSSAIWRRWLVTERAAPAPQTSRPARTTASTSVLNSAVASATSTPKPLLSPEEWQAQLEAQTVAMRTRQRAAEEAQVAEQAECYAAVQASKPDILELRRREHREAARHVMESLAERRRILAERAGEGKAPDIASAMVPDAVVSVTASTPSPQPIGVYSCNGGSADSSMPASSHTVRSSADATHTENSGDTTVTRCSMRDPSPQFARSESKNAEQWQSLSLAYLNMPRPTAGSSNSAASTGPDRRALPGTAARSASPRQPFRVRSAWPTLFHTHYAPAWHSPSIDLPSAHPRGEAARQRDRTQSASAQSGPVNRRGWTLLADNL